MKGTKEQKLKNKTLKVNHGITLIALVITIVLMLILATITVNVVIDGGLFDYAKDAKDNTEIASEKETVQKAKIIAESTSKTGRVTVEEIQKAINKVANDNTGTVMDNSDSIVVKFNNSNRYYEINNNGSIEGPKELIQDKYVGDLTKGGICDGSINKPFQITCIEDLITFSIMVNGGDSELGIDKNLFSNQYVILTRPLDFKSLFSYNDYQTTKYDKYLGGDGTTELKTQLSQKGKGFIPIGASNYFCGNFNGNNHEIKNIYVNTSTNAGLFGTTSSANFENIIIKGEIISTSNTGGIVGTANGNSIIKNCSSNVKVKGETSGGIVGFMGTKTKFINCYNYGDVVGNWAGVGGFIGYGNAGSAEVTIINSGNFGNLTLNRAGHSYSGTGGLIGLLTGGSSTVDIYNCFNVGEITGDIYAGGMVAHQQGENSTSNIYNSYTAGKFTARSYAGSFGRALGTINADKFYYLSEHETNEDIDTSFIELEKNIMQSQAFIDNYLNKNVEEYNLANKENTDFVELKSWKMNNEIGYPTCE